ncbi:hypothetical protein [Actinomycetospora sp. TBRC 11914]|nr:hypothetical protein [Actinomycetospora sp. TBRC 11914]
MPITLDRNLILLVIGLGCAYLVSPMLAGVLAAIIVLGAIPIRLR